MKIVFLSHTIRSSIFRVGSYYLSKKFSELGHDVLYISSPLTLAHLIYYRLGTHLIEFEQRWALRKAGRDEDGVLNHVPFLLFPFTGLGLFSSYKRYQRLNFNFSRTFNQITESGFENPDLILQDSLKLNFCRKFFRSGKWVYRATDLYTKMPDAPSTMQEAEEEAITFADSVVTTSEPLKKHIKDMYGRDAKVLCNGVNYEHFDEPREKPEEYKSISGPICVYVGSMDERFDHELVNKLAVHHNFNIVLIGPPENNVYEGQENIFLLGKKHPDQLPPYLQHADVGLLPFKMVPANHARSPMKIYEYGASGLPVVSMRLDEVERRNSKFVYLAESHETFIALVGETIKKKNKVLEKAKQESRQHSWNKIADDFLRLL